MKNIIYNVIFVLLIGLSFGNSQTITKSGTTTAQFLKIGMGARGTGMGDAATAIVDDASSVYWNPAGLAFISQGEISASHINWIAGINCSNFTFSIPLPGVGAVGLYATSVTIPKDEVTTVTQPEGTGEFFDGGDFSVGLAFGKSVTDRFAFGVVGKYIHERIWSMSASSLAINVGSIYHSEWRNFRIGFILSNYGTSMKFSGRANLVTTDPDPVVKGNNEFIRAELELEEWDIPMSLTTSFALDIYTNEKIKSLLAIDIVHPNDNVEFFNVGMELTILNMISIRAGSRHIGQVKAVGTAAFGGGIKIPVGTNKLNIDYSLTDFGHLKNVNQLSLSFGF
ncbi:MAG: PorV/PorQ family protein [Fidelibacterota bacterium]